jgi:hypothetical protein
MPTHFVSGAFSTLDKFAYLRETTLVVGLYNCVLLCLSWLIETRGVCVLLLLLLLLLLL